MTMMMMMMMMMMVVVVMVMVMGGVKGQSVYEYGAHNIDVTPTAEMIENREVWLGGFGIGRTRLWPTGVHDPIVARAWVISDGNTSMAFVVSDVTGTSNLILRAIRDAVNGNTGIPVANIHISSTHTHGGPDLQGLWHGSSDNYKSYFIAGVVEAITTAWLNRRSARLYVSYANISDWQNNRRGYGWSNGEMNVIEARDAVTDQVLGTTLNFAAHPTNTGASNREFTGDWCWYTNSLMEAAKGGAPTSYFNGPQGDIGGLGGCSGGTNVWENVQICGERMAQIALDSMVNQVQVTGPLSCTTHYYNHPVTNPAFILAYFIGWLDYDVIINGTEYSFDTQTSYFRIGDQIQGVAFPGESLTRNAYPILQEMTAPFTMFLGLTGDTLGYFVPSDEWNYLTGYEEKVSIDRFVGDVTRDILIDLIRADTRK